MKHRFDIDKLSYVAEFVGDHEFIFYVDVVESKINPYVMSKECLSFGDVSPLKIFSKIDSKDVFKIKSHLAKFIDSVLSRYDPYYFFYRANEDHKRSVYYKFGLYIAKKYGYNMYVDDVLGKFSFYKS
jgi:hypothetical protein